MIKALEISLIITAIYASMWDGMLFGWLRIGISNVLDKIKLPFLKMPLFDCLICMGGIWSVLIYSIMYGIDIEIIYTTLMVIGINTIIDKILQHD